MAYECLIMIFFFFVSSLLYNLLDYVFFVHTDFSLESSHTR